MMVSVKTQRHSEFVDITERVAQAISSCDFATTRASGVLSLFVPHTTCGLTVQENADPPLRDDILSVFAKIFPWKGNYQHCEDNAAAHMKSMLVGTSLSIPVRGGRLSLGQWQAIFLCEFDGPRERRVELTFCPGFS